MTKSPLNEYRKKRDFTKTAEPKGGRSKNRKPIFVVQKHDATRLHYDFRLEVDGVLKSWAVPKGPSLNPKDKRLAVATEDHPMDYARFEGVIPEGEYGAGPVIVWDTGTYENIKMKHGKPVSMPDCLQTGQVEVRLDGEKMKGAYALIRTGYSGKDNWLLIKMKDAEASARRNPVSAKPRSVLSDRTIAEVRTGKRPGRKKKK